jgi:hypothetical protein
VEGKAKYRSIDLRNLTRVINILVKEKTPFIFSFNVESPLQFRDPRGILATGRILGIPEAILKSNYLSFKNRIEINRTKLSK